MALIMDYLEGPAPSFARSHFDYYLMAAFNSSTKNFHSGTFVAHFASSRSCRGSSLGPFLSTASSHTQLHYQSLLTLS